MVVVMGGWVGELRDDVAAGIRPRVEILELTGRHGIALCCYDDLPDGWLVRAASRRIGHHWVLALLTLLRFRRGEVLIVTGEDVGFPFAIVQGIVPRRWRARVALIAHGSYLNSARARFVCRHLLSRRKDVSFLTLSSALRSAMIERLGLRSSQVVNVGYGADVSFFQPEARDRSSTFRVVSAGMASRDYRTLVAAMDGVPGELKIAADSAWFQASLDLDGVDLSGVELRSYGGYVPLRQLYASASVVVVPLQPVRHACGYAVIAEAMAMGRPLIVTRTEGHSDFVDDGVTGWYVEPGDVDGLRARLRYVADSPAIAEAVGARARMAMVERDSVEAVADRIVSAATELGANRPQR